MPEYRFIEFTGKKADPPKLYKCPNCKKAGLRYAKFFGSDGELLTTDGKESYFDMSRKPISNTGWLTDPNTKVMHECIESGNIQIGPVTISSKQEVNYEEGVKRTDLLVPQAKELDIESLAMESRKKEFLFECALLWKEEEWITNYLIEKSLRGELPNPAKVGMWHKLISERLARTHEPD